MRAAAAALLMAAMGAPAAARADIVSLSPCLDDTLARIAPARLLAVSHWSHDPAASQMGAASARRWPATRGTAEAVIRLRPGLVVAGTHIDPATLNALRRAGLRVELFGVPGDVPAALAEVARLGRLTGAEGPAAALARDMRAALAAPARAPGAVLMRGGEGLTPGRATLPGDVMARLRVPDAAAAYGVTGWGQVGLEALSLRPPALLLAARGRTDRALTHPILARLQAGGLRRAPFDGRLLNCGGAAVIGLAAAVRAAAGAP